ncbi:MAG: hypothetical protein B7Z08_05960 [Sphingomonadales bacterium 32-68-7]|nr:MAG: hypothetical protein B7Z33_11210 [Sphingomonadales bacterium 12-68-11]OYX09294.1 MAG: hypothetical protein B7Z08_05960 [Sphingomonadales bacterium 32-68-7]
MRALGRTPEISLSTVGKAELPELSMNSIPDGAGLVFPELGVAVVNPTAEGVAAISSAVAKTDALELMEPERFVYTTGEIDLSWLRGFRDATNEIYERLAEKSTGSVGGQTVPTFDESQATWGLQATQVLQSRWTGKGVRIAILDTGIDLGHQDFRSRQILAESFIHGEPVADGNGHGTHCAGVAAGPVQPGTLPRYGVAPGAELMVGKVLANSGRGTDGQIIAGINWAIANKADIVSMSLGAPVTEGQNFSAVFQQIAEIALARGTLIIAAAGNDSHRPRDLRPVSHPGNCPGIMAVGALDRTYRLGWFSNSGLNLNGGKVDIVGPGVDIYSSFPTGTPPYRRLDGTSMATPYVAGIAALYAEATGLRANALWAELTRRALPINQATSDVGAGLAQAPQ